MREEIFCIMEIESSTMGRKSISVAKKLEIIQKANETGNVKGTAEAYKVQPKQVRYWRGQIQQLIGKISINRRAKTIHSGNGAHHPELESNVYSCRFYWKHNL